MELEEIGGWTIHNYLNWLGDYSRVNQKTKRLSVSTVKKGEFREYFNREHPYLINPVLFSFVAPITISIEGEEPITLRFDARSLPDVRIRITEHFLRQNEIFRKEKRKVVRFSRLGGWLEKTLTAKTVQVVTFETSKVHHAARKHLYRLFHKPTRHEIANALIKDRDLWVEDTHLWPFGQCSNCSRPLVHPISKLLGIGPECGGHEYKSGDEVIESFRLVISRFDKKLYFQMPPQLNPILFERLRKNVEEQRTT
jgi:hypothetical protein